MTAVIDVAIGNGNLFSSSGCKNPLHPTSSAMPTSGNIMINPSGIIYQGEPFGTPQQSANMNAPIQNNPVIIIVVNGLGVCIILLKYSFIEIFSALFRVINNAINGVGVEKNIPITAYIV